MVSSLSNLSLRRVLNSSSEDPPTSLRPPLVTNNRRSSTPQPELLQSPDRLSRPASRQSDRRPIGPRSVSPVSALRSPDSVSELPYLSDDPSPRASPELQPAQKPSSIPRHQSGVPTPTPRSKRQVSHPSGVVEATPRASISSTTLNTSALQASASGSSLVEPLSIKKKSSVRSSMVHNSPLARKANMRSSPSSRPGVISPRRGSPQMKRAKAASQPPNSSLKSEISEHIIWSVVSTKEDVSLRAVLFCCCCK